MKLAILGSSPLALEAALRFHLHGAALTWFNFQEIEYEGFLQQYLPGDAYVSADGLGLLQESGKSYRASDGFDFEHWKNNYYRPLSELLQQEHKLRAHQVINVSKRYLAPFEQIPGTSRFHDLFRIIFQVNPQEFIKEQEKTNPETFERLSQELIDSLQTNLEMYEDFDLVLDLRRPVQVKSVSVTGRALGEGRVSPDHLKYGFDGLLTAKAINQDAQDVREVALIGSDALAAEILLSLKDWLKDQRSRVFIVTHEANPFENYLGLAENSSAKALNALFEEMEGEFQNDVNEFHKKLREWQELDDFIQVKKPKPVEPIPRLVYFSGHNASAVDQLIDKRRLFLTLEKPEFRQGLKQPENNSLELKTIGADRILVANQLMKPAIERELAQAEVGYFDVDLTLPNVAQAWSKDLERLKGIENEIFKLFSPAGAH